MTNSTRADKLASVPARTAGTDAGAPYRNYVTAALGRVLGMSKASLIALAVIILIGAIANPTAFLTLGNLHAVLLFWPIVAICALGQLFAILSGGIDLSLAGIFVVVGATTMRLHADGLNDVATICVALLVGVACGLLNGVLIGFLRVIPLACTLATLFLFSGIATWLSGGSTLYGAPESLRWIVAGSWGPIPFTVIVGAAVLLLAVLFLYRTSVGLKIRAFGDSPKIVQVAGLRRPAIQLWVYALSALCFSIAALVQMGTLNSFYANGGADLLLPAVAAAALGGAVLTGGTGSVFGLAVGALVLAAVGNVFDLLRWSPESQQIGIGVVLVVTLLVEKFITAKTAGRRNA